MAEGDFGLKVERTPDAGRRLERLSREIGELPLPMRDSLLEIATLLVYYKMCKAMSPSADENAVPEFSEVRRFHIDSKMLRLYRFSDIMNMALSRMNWNGDIAFVTLDQLPEVISAISIEYREDRVFEFLETFGETAKTVFATRNPEEIEALSISMQDVGRTVQLYEDTIRRDLLPAYEQFVLAKSERR